MQAVVFDLDHTIFDANQALHEGVADLLAILRNLGVQIGAISTKDHRMLVHLDEAGIRQYFSEVMCSAHSDNPKSTASLYTLMRQMGAQQHQTTLISHAHADILLGKDAKLAKTIGVSHGNLNAMPLHEAGADHVVANIPEVLDVLH
jgi:phosphoglycolate phosphatase-like HAD superfamily hydrolase